MDFHGLSNYFINFAPTKQQQYDNWSRKRNSDALYASLFKKPRRHIAIITALAKKKSGLLREEVLKTSKLTDNTDFSKALQELEQCGFILQSPKTRTKR